MAENKIVEPTIFTSNKLFIQEVISNRYIYVIVTFCLLFSIYIYNKIAQTEYEVYATMIATRDKTTSMLSSNDLFAGMQSFQSYGEIEDGINKLRSYSLIYNIIDELNLEVGYFSQTEDLFKIKSELYLNKPFTVNIHKSHFQPIYTKFYIETLSDSTFRIYADKSKAMLFNYIDNKVVVREYPVNIDEVHRFSEDISLDYMRITIDRNKDFTPEDPKKKYRYYFEMYNPELMTKQYLKNLSIRRASAASSILYVTFKGENLQKSIYFINSYLNYFIEESLLHKNSAALNTISFIDSQITGISDSLQRSESEITSYRSSNQVMNLSYQGQLAYDNLQRLETDRSDLQSQETYYSYILNYLNSTDDVAGIVPPSSMNVNNSVMNDLIVELLRLNSERANIISLRGERNLFLAEVENKLKLQRQYIIEIASNNLNTVKRRLSDLDYESQKLTSEIAALPRREINMGNIQRRFNIDETIYTYLLQKRSEATITLASNFPDFELIEHARQVTSFQSKPKYIVNYLIALILGVVLPTAYMILRSLFNFKITSPEYIQQLINRPPVSTIFSIPEKNENFIIDDPNSASTENFRALRSIVFRKLPGTKSKIILITSAQPQDGKSFISYNLALSIAMVGKKTLIIDGDLKRPTLHKKFQYENKSGLSDYLLDNVSLNEIISNTAIPNLSFIPGGPQMPNTTELIEAGGLDVLINSVREQFEYIIIDTSPIGFMADAFLMTHYADYILITVRNNSTMKESFTNVLANLNSNSITNYDIIFNDRDNKESTRYYSKYYMKGKMS